MAITINGTTGISGVDGSAGTPSLQGGDANTGFFYGSDILGFSTGGTERMRLDSSGNLGLGVTPSAWNSGSKVVEVGGAGNALWYVGSNDFRLNANAYFNGVNYIYGASQPASYYRQAIGTHAWFAAPSGTAGNAITFTQAMTLDASGNLIVNGAAPTFAPSTSGLNMYYETDQGYGTIGSFSNGGTTALTFHTSGSAATSTERMRIDYSGNVGIGLTNPSTKLDVAGDVQAVHGSGAFAYRVRADPTNTIGAIQWTNNGQNVDWGYISCPQRGVMNFRAPDGATSSTLAEFVFSAGGVCVNKQTSSGGDVGDWPVPAIGIKNYDSNFNYVTMQTWGLRDDTAMYQTGSSVWNFRLGTSSSGATTSDSNTYMFFNGPGPLVCQSAASGGVILTNAATSWASYSDETLKDIIEPIEDAANKVSTLRAVIGKFKTDPSDKRRAFLIAQDVQAVLPEAVSTTEVPVEPVDPEDVYKPIAKEEKLLLSYTDTIPLLVAAIQELKAEIDALKGAK